MRTQVLLLMRKEINTLGGESSYLRLYLYLKFVTGSKLSLALVVVVAMVVKEEGQQAEQLSPCLPATKTSILHSHNYCIITLPAT